MSNGNESGRMPAKTKIHLKLFVTAFYISAVTFGSGYVIVSIIKKRFVDQLKWIDEAEMLNLIALAQSSPGAMAANTALLVGYKVCGAIGAFLAVLGVALPPLITISVLSIFYNALRENAVVSAVLKGMQAGACAVICDVVSSLFINVIKDKNMRTTVKIAIMASAFFAAFVFNVSFILIVLFFIFLGVVLHFISRARKEKGNDLA